VTEYSGTTLIPKGAQAAINRQGDLLVEPAAWARGQNQS